jgi:hypothetical protein
MQSGSAYVKCLLSRGPFSGERIFDIELADGARYVGIAPRQSCLIGGRQVNLDEPRPDETVPAMLDAYFVRNGGENAVILIPDGERVEVPVQAVCR